MPEQLLGRIIRVSSGPGELVLDSFSGSGTTLAVAKKLGRQWLGVELSRDYVTRIKERLARIKAGDPLIGPADPVRSAPKTSQGKRRGQFRNGQPVPQGDENTLKGVIEAFDAACRGHSTDFMLCNPDMNAAFIDACKSRSLSGNAFVWNRLLLRIRKAGRLPRVTEIPKRYTFEAMDRYSHASEVAMRLMGLDYGLALDDILCRPDAASEFDRIAESFAPGHTPFEYRWAALAIRKRATKSRHLAITRFKEWLARKLPRATPLAQCKGDKFAECGVYIIDDGDQPLYVGETFNLRDRLDAMETSRSWSDLKASSVKFIRQDNQYAHGLQSILIRRVHPLLNSQLLCPMFENAASGDS